VKGFLVLLNKEADRTLSHFGLYPLAMKCARAV